MPVTLPKEVRYESVRWIKAGKSTIPKEAKRRKVSEQAVKNWMTRYEKEMRNGLPAVAGNRAPVIAQSTTPANHPGNPAPGNAVPASDAFARAVESARLDSNPEPDQATSPDGGLVAPGIDPQVPEDVSDPPPIPLPEIKPEDLVAFSEMLVVEIPSTFAILKGVPIQKEAFAYTDTERKALMTTAPYACQYAPAWMAKIPAVMAGVFVGTLIMQVVQRFGMVKRMAYEMDKAKREIKKAEQDKEPEPRSVDEKLPKRFDAQGFPIG